MEKNWWKIGGIIAIAIGLLVLGFFAGRATIKTPEPKIITKYIKSEPIRDTLYNVKPYYVETPVDTSELIKQCVLDGLFVELFPEKIVEVEKYRPTSEDTLAILADYASKKYYSEEIFNIDTVGKCVVNADVQYNRITSMGYVYTPVSKETTITKVAPKRKITPDIGVGMTSFPSVMGEAGLYYGNIGAGFNYQYLWETKESIYGMMVKIKF